MNWTHRIRTGLAGAGHSPDDEVVEELALHARAVYDTARAEGASAAEADERVDAADCALGQRGAEAPAASRTARRSSKPPASATSRLVGVAHDLRYAMRLLRRRPGATLRLDAHDGAGHRGDDGAVQRRVGRAGQAPAVAGGGSARAAVRNPAGQHPPPAADLTNGTYLAWRDARGTIDDIGGWSASTVTVTEPGDPQRIRIGAVTATMFSLLGAKPAIGALFTTDTAESEFVLSHALWHQLFAGSPGALGATVRIDGEPRTVVAVMPRGFTFPDRGAHAWVPLRVRQSSARIRKGATFRCSAAWRGSSRASRRRRPPPRQRARPLRAGSGSDGHRHLRQSRAGGRHGAAPSSTR